MHSSSFPDNECAHVLQEMAQHLAIEHSILYELVGATTLPYNSSLQVINKYIEQ